ncbi:Chemotaxis response regulator protein-glutamate methylesterase CheB [hydrothermal vent metagenome]|uniref:protein-glutamate methylesterase n=1 Tax=hydrothermal vent metagenome TaxID=652676 RepID=A0A3B0TAA1_9ZZZZ
MALSNAAARTIADEQAGSIVRVMVVDDSVVIRGLVSRWLAEDSQIDVVAKCANGAIAVEQVGKARPDVIILDIEMPVMDGLTALPKLLAARPGVHVIIASTLTKRNAAISLKALALGAAECLPKPEGNSGITTSADFRRDLLIKVRGLGGLDGVVRPARPAPVPAAAGAPARPVPAAGHGRREIDQKVSLQPYNRGVPRVLVIGSSTGGPQALAKVLGSLDGAIANIPCFITQHMPPTFTAMLAQNIARSTGLPCAEAAQGDVPKAGHIYIAPGGKHLLVKRRGAGHVCQLDDGPPVNFTKPCVDVMFDSVSESYGANILSVILTGMGADGAMGAARIRAAGGNVIAQDEASSVVWGMPGATAQSGACSALLPIEKIGPEISRICRGKTL